MKVLHVSTSDTGGAAIAALRLHQALLQEKVSSKFLCLNNSNTQIPEIYSFPKKSPSLLLKGLRKLGVYHSQTDINKKKVKSLRGDHEIFSFPNTDFDILQHHLVGESDIINLHWVADFLDWSSFFKKIRKPIVWTLHDMNPFLGGFHYTDDLQRNKLAYGHIENVLRKKKYTAIQSTNALTIIGLTNWLIKASEESLILGAFPHVLIPNSLDLKIFRPFEQSFSRDIFQLPQHKQIILFIADSITNYRKGLDILLEALPMISGNNFTIVTVGGGMATNLAINQEHIHLGRIQDERLLALAYSAADLFVIPSREDNLPNTVLESLACGTPVVGFRIGGIPEMVNEGKNGFLCSDIDAQKLAGTIQQALNYHFDREWIREDAIARFDQPIQSKKYIDLYNSVL